MEINLKDKFALIMLGGSVGQFSTHLVSVGRDMCNIIETGNDKDALVEKKKRRNNQLSPGEKSYYGMKYKVVSITNSIRMQIY